MGYEYYVTTTTVPTEWGFISTTGSNLQYTGTGWQTVRFTPQEEAWESAIREYITMPIGVIQTDEVEEDMETELVDDSEELDEYLDEFAIKAG